MADPRDPRGADDDVAEGFLPALPVIPPELSVDPLLAALLHVVAALDLSDDDVVEPDFAIDALEHVGLYVARLSPERVRAVQAQLDAVAAHGRREGWPDDSIEVVTRFLENCGLERSG